MGVEISMMGNWVEIQKQAMMVGIISTKASSLGPLLVSRQTVHCIRQG
jgi:putative Mn2+ efflux pump MntP